MKFNIALIAAVASSSLLMSSVSAQSNAVTPAFDCDTSGRVAKGGLSTFAGDMTDCEADKCKTGHCQVESSFDNAKACVAEGALGANMKCNAISFLAECKDAFHQLSQDKKSCEPTPALKAATNECAKPEAVKAGKILKDDTCTCEHGDETIDNKVVCKCVQNGSKKRNADGLCPVDCVAKGRAAAGKEVYTLAECGACKETAHCELPDGSCDAAPADGKCVEKKAVCNEGFKFEGNKCVVDNTLRDECAAKNRKFDESTKKCKECKDNYVVVTEGGKCYPEVGKEDCNSIAEAKNREFSDKKLCVCKAKHHPTSETEESSLTDVCVSGAAQLFVSSVVLLSSVAATALFFL